jgi:hypothetical protein
MFLHRLIQHKCNFYAHLNLWDDPHNKLLKLNVIKWSWLSALSYPLVLWQLFIKRLLNEYRRMCILINNIRIHIYIYSLFFQFTSPKAIRNTTPPLARHNTSPCVTFTVGLSLVLWPWGVKYNDKTNHRGYTALRQTARCKTNISEVTFSTLLLGALLK